MTRRPFTVALLVHLGSCEPERCSTLNEDMLGRGTACPNPALHHSMTWHRPGFVYI